MLLDKVLQEVNTPLGSELSSSSTNGQTDEYKMMPFCIAY